MKIYDEIEQRNRLDRAQERNCSSRNYYRFYLASNSGLSKDRVSFWLGGQKGNLGTRNTIKELYFFSRSAVILQGHHLQHTAILRGGSSSHLIHAAVLVAPASVVYSVPAPLRVSSPSDVPYCTFHENTDRISILEYNTIFLNVIE
ncbi:uncharacterized protein [Henckelia pumila]|uniref:uncharacterized protein isoform X1 n=1 Tax=Henckelia pumila TaxID=405737 RepID=UPI003C6E1827